MKILGAVLDLNLEFRVFFSQIFFCLFLVWVEFFARLYASAVGNSLIHFTGVRITDPKLYWMTTRRDKQGEILHIILHAPLFE